MISPLLLIMKFVIALSVLFSACLAQEDDSDKVGNVEILKVEVKVADLSKIADLVIFNLYTRKNPEVPQVLKMEDKESISKSNFDSTKPTYVTVHGWRNSLSDVSIQASKTALLLRYDCNIIGVEWGTISSASYQRAVTGVPRVGVYVAEMLKHMVSSANLDLKKTNLVGYGLGAQVCGFVGKNLKGLARITGLDPARIGFTFADSTGRLDATDADFVDCIFTSRKLGFRKPVCGANFYINGGRRQPGCGIDLAGLCSHGRALDLYTESVSGKSKFKAALCKSLPNSSGRNCVASDILMGEPADHSAKGIYYVKTHSKSPFAVDF